MKFIKKSLLFCLIMVLFITPIYGNAERTFASTSSHWFKIELTPSSAGERAEYHIYGGIVDYDGIDSLEIFFKWDTDYLFENPTVNSVTINGVLAKNIGFRTLDTNDIKMIIGLRNKVNKGTALDIKINRDAGLVNATMPRPCYQVRVYLLRNGVEVDSIGSEQYRITQSIVSQPNVIVEPAIKGMQAEYRVSFVTGINGILHKNEDDIRIKFPEGTHIPVNSLAKYIYINGVQCVNGVYRDNDNPDELRIYIPIEIEAKTPVTVFIKKEFGLANTSNVGMQTLYVSTYREPDWVESKSFDIASPKVKNLKLTLNSDIISLKTSLHMSFTTSPVGFLMKSKSIYINFPDGFTLPELIDSSFATVNGKNADTEVSGRQVIIHVPENIGNNDDVVIEVSDGAHITNPIFFGDYAIEVYTDSDSYAVAVTVSITQSSVKNVVLDALYSGMGAKNEFNITFTTGPAGKLTSGVDYVKVGFGNAFEFSETANEETIFVNDIPVNNVSIDVYSVVALVPLDIEPNSEVKVKIPVDFGIRNPEEIGDYALKISTSKETAEIESNILTITVLPVVEFTVTPSSPDGESGFYRKHPSVQLSTSNGKDVYFKLDDGDFQLYSNKFSIPEGEHKLLAYANDETGNKGDVEERNFKVDSTPPTVSFDQGSGDIYVNKMHTVLTGKVSEPCVLQINGIPATVGSDLSFHVELDVMDKFPLAIYARDIAGNSVSIMRTVYLDEELPVITTLSPDEEQYSTTEETVNIRLKLNEEGTVTLNGKAMDFDGNIFSMTVNLYNGENNFYITAADLAGNKITKNITISRVNEIVITLQIGSNIAYVGSEMKTLDTSPIIQNGRTLVPLRFIWKHLVPLWIGMAI